LDCCTEHARAAAGLPAIDASMPEPAGTGLSRRSFLLRSAGLAPVGDPAYRRLRPTLAVSDGRAFAEDSRLAWHPAASALADLHGEGKVSVLPAVGYTNADQSHFTSRHFWEVGALDPHLRTGWLGRVLDRIGSPDNPLQGVSLDGQLSPTLATARNPVAAKPEDSGFWTPGAWGVAEDLALTAFTNIGHILPVARWIGKPVIVK
jgi:uncharacterized protein (DUF1501 family)